MKRDAASYPGALPAVTPRQMTSETILQPLVRLRANPWLRATLLFLYYLGIIIGLLFIYGRGDFKTAPFVYQGF